MKICWILLFGMALAVSALRARAESSAVADSILAVVGDTPITQQQVEQLIDQDQQALAQRYGNQPDIFYKKVASLQESGSELLIRREVILQDFKQNIKVPDSIIEEYVQDEIKKRFPGVNGNIELTKQLELEGLTPEQFKKRIRDQFIVNAMQDKFVTDPIISPKKIEDYYMAHRNDFKLEDQVRMRMIVLGKVSADDTNVVEQTRRRASELVSQLKGGATFADLARTYSEGSAAKDGGDTGWEDASVVNKLLVAELDKLKPGEYSGVIEAPDGFYLVMLEDRHPAHYKPLNDVREQIERTLDSAERERLAIKWINRLKEKTFILKF
ncbi:MAG TPA: peptidyl-prolyl cis-trans isomerase [Verrucomicrobiae bacterium]|nr:peptidyl-prolyl cis-trans isomerase [Verrucomicrobiae bacterium]